MLDKLLILILILLLPLAIFYTQKLNNTDQSQKQATKYLLTEEGIQRLEQLLQQLQQDRRVQAQPTPAFQITNAFYSTQSSQLQLAGIAPRNDINLLYAVIPQNQSTTGTNSAVLGAEVKFHTLSVNTDQVFALTLPLPSSVPDKLEIILQQGNQQATLVYDFVQQRSFVY